jgi:hypothetical protein
VTPLFVEETTSRSKSVRGFWRWAAVEMAGWQRARDDIRSGERASEELQGLARPPPPQRIKGGQFACTRVLTAWGYCETAVMCPIVKPQIVPAGRPEAQPCSFWQRER